MKNYKAFFPILAVFFFAALPAFGGSSCSNCPEGAEEKDCYHIQPIATILPTSVASLNSTPGAVVLNPGYSNAYLHPAEMLIGRVPGVWVSGGYNFYQIRIRGAQGPPLLVIDNMPFYGYSDWELNDLLWSISTADIERIEVLKNLASTSLYSGAANGVIRVVTRGGSGEE